MRAFTTFGSMLALAAVSATAASALPAGGRLTVSVYRSRANAICIAERQQTMGTYTHTNSLQDYLNTELPILQHALTALQKLSPPTEFARVHKQILTTVQSELDFFTLNQMSAAAGLLTLSDWQKDLGNRSLADHERALWKEVGAKRCAL